MIALGDGICNLDFMNNECWHEDILIVSEIEVFVGARSNFGK